MNLRPYTDERGCAVLVACVLAAAEVQDRLNETPRLPYVRKHEPTPPKAPADPARDLSTFTPHENALFRALSERFPPEKCREMVIRARAAERQS